MAVRGVRTTSGSYLDRPEPRHRSTLRSWRMAGHHETLTIENDQNRLRGPPFPPGKASTRSTTTTSASASRLRTDTPRSHTHVQHSCGCVHVHTGGGPDGRGSGHVGEDHRKLLAGLGDDEAYRTRCGCQLRGRSGRHGSVTPTQCGSRWDGPQKSSRSERPRSLPENTRSMPTRHGCASGVSRCGVGRVNSGPESNRRSWCQSLRHVSEASGPRRCRCRDPLATTWRLASHAADDYLHSGGVRATLVVM